MSEADSAPSWCAMAMASKIADAAEDLLNRAAATHSRDPIEQALRLLQIADDIACGSSICHRDRHCVANRPAGRDGVALRRRAQALMLQMMTDRAVG